MSSPGRNFYVTLCVRPRALCGFKREGDLSLYVYSQHGSKHDAVATATQTACEQYRVDVQRVKAVSDA